MNKIGHFFRQQHRPLSSSIGKFISPMDFKPKKALVVTKVSRYEFERSKFGHLSESDFEQHLTTRGSDYTMIKYHHNIHKTAEENVIRALESRGVETKKCQRMDYTNELIDWADIIFTTGGDGTFLLGASKVRTPDKPVVGINTDPTRSEGYLCLPKHFSFSLDHAIEELLSGHFRWFFRRRLRITLIGDQDKINENPCELHNQELVYPEYRYVDFLQEKSVTAGDHPLKQETTGKEVSERVLPVLALNEVFLGESLSSRVSYLEVKFDNNPVMKTRNSGLCISTGTGSTSWTFNISKLTHQSVETILKFVFETTRYPINFKDHKLVETITQRFNNELVFDPELNLMCYTLRDPVSAGTFPTAVEKKPRGKARRVEIKSRCFDACLVIDGSLSYKFNDGTRAIVSIHDEDVLRTVHIYSSDI